LFDGPLQVWDAPELPIGASRRWAEQLGWSIKMQAPPEVLNLFWLKLGSIATNTLVGQRLAAIGAILAAPLHQANATAASDLPYLLEGIAGAVESDGLVASAGGAIFTADVSIGQFFNLLWV
jgi:hypothetical protein